MQQTPYDGAFAVGSDTLLTRKIYVSCRNFTTVYYRLITPMFHVFIIGIITVSDNFSSVYFPAYSMGPLDERRPVHYEFYQQIGRNNCHSAALSVRNNTLLSREANKGTDVLLRQVWP